jgi:hypothetical protein
MNNLTPMLWLLTTAYQIVNIPFRLVALLSGRSAADEAPEVTIKVDIQPVNFDRKKMEEAIASSIYQSLRDRVLRSFIPGGLVGNPALPTMTIPASREETPGLDKPANTAESWMAPAEYHYRRLRRPPIQVSEDRWIEDRRFGE